MRDSTYYDSGRRMLMIYGIGADIIEVDRIRNIIYKHRGFVSRVFTKAEQDYCLSFSRPEERFAGRFAAKEAVAKALGTSLSWHDVEVVNGDSGKPSVCLRNNAAEIAAGRTVQISISHCRSYAVAYAIVE